MVDSSATPKLKRKGEGADSLRKTKKAKVQIASTATPNVATPPSNVKTAATDSIFINGTPKTTGTPSQSAKKSKKRSKERKSVGDSSESATASITPAPAPSLVTKEDPATGVQPEDSRSSRKDKKKRRQEAKHAADLNEDVPAPDIGDNLSTEDGFAAAQDAISARIEENIEEAEGEQPKSGARKADQSSITLTEAPTTELKHNKKAKKAKTRTPAPWSASPPFGGWFLDQEPLFLSNEQCLLLANKHSLLVYSTESSLLADTFSVAPESLSAYALSAEHPNCTYTATTSGLISLWDWDNSKKIGRWDIGANVQHMAVIPQRETRQDLVYCHEAGKRHFINVHALQTSQTEMKTILKSKQPINGMQILLEGDLVIVATSSSFLVGERRKSHKTGLLDLEYRWREIQTSRAITTFDAYLHVPDEPQKKQSSKDQKHHVDLAIGHDDGVIHLFEDILAAFSFIEKSRKAGSKAETPAETLQPKRLHWHREAVGSLKWSRDGNYIISGGDESVLVIWQLTTGKQQYLPHLTAAIENIVLSPTGASYAVRLANNSVVVLSTTELDAKTHIVGVQSRRIDTEQISRNNNHGLGLYERFRQVPLVVDPKRPSQVFVTTPSSQSRSQMRSTPDSYLQTIDIATHRPVGRQALTRNNVTDINVGPNRIKLLEPNVSFLQISENGEWLATVDKWSPPETDLDFVDGGFPGDKEEEHKYRREVHLKFWRRDEQNQQWVLVSRTVAPHFFETVGAHARVLDLISDPSDVGFASVGEDGIVRIWRPKTRQRNGVMVRGARKDGAVIWSLEREVTLSTSLDLFEPGQNDQTSVAPRTARLAFSSDGSLLAVGVSWGSKTDPGVIHIVDANTGSIRRSITEVDVTVLSCMGILGRHLIVISDSIIVWDLVVDELVHHTSLCHMSISQQNRIPLLRLAMNEPDQTFAFAHPQFDTKSHGAEQVSTRIHIYNPYQREPLWSHTAPGVILALAPTEEGKGYIALDSSSRFTVFNRRSAASQLITPPPEDSASAPNANKTQDEEAESEDENMLDATGVVPDLTEDDALFEATENDKPVVRPEQLQAVFDSGLSHALPPVKDLFYAVAGLYARKSKPVPAA